MMVGATPLSFRQCVHKPSVWSMSHCYDFSSESSRVIGNIIPFFLISYKASKYHLSYAARPVDDLHHSKRVSASFSYTRSTTVLTWISTEMTTYCSGGGCEGGPTGSFPGGGSIESSEDGSDCDRMSKACEDRLASE